MERGIGLLDQPMVARHFGLVFIGASSDAIVDDGVDGACQLGNKSCLLRCGQRDVLELRVIDEWEIFINERSGQLVGKPAKPFLVELASVLSESGALAAS